MLRERMAEEFQEISRSMRTARRQHSSCQTLAGYLGSSSSGGDESPPSEKIESLQKQGEDKLAAEIITEEILSAGREKAT